MREIDFRVVALDYLNKGWNPLPIPHRRKEPPPAGFTGEHGRSVTPIDIEQWCDLGKWGNLAVRVPENVIGIDIDHYDSHYGADSIEQAEKRLGKLPATFSSTSRPNSRSGIWFYKVPAVPSGGRWNGDPLPHVQVIQHRHRYAIVAPSEHKTTGNPYRWYDPCGVEIDDPPPVDDLTELSWSWIDELQELPVQPASNGSQTKVTISSSNSKDRHRSVQEAVDRWHATKHHGRHDAMVRATMALARLESLNYPGASKAIEEVCDDFDHLVTSDNSRSGWESSEEIRRALESAHEKVKSVPSTTQPYDPVSEFVYGIDWSISGPEVQLPAQEMPELNLPEEFWEARPSLHTIRDAARSSLTSPDALLGVTLARVATLIPPEIQLPDTGATRTLNIAVALVGRPGQGKSSANSIGRELIPEPIGEQLENNVGTGEGFIEAYLDTIREDGKTIKTLGRKVNLFYIDEGKGLLEIGKRKGATIMETIRSAISGETLGQRNATVETSRRLEANSYRAAIIIGLQPRIAMELLNDSHGGTPQRFIWFHAGDPQAPSPGNRPPWPGSLNVEPIINEALRKGHRPIRLTIDPKVREQIETESWLNLTGKKETSEEDSHTTLSQLKVATLLSILDQRLHVTDEDWMLARSILGVSRAVRTWVKRRNFAETEIREHENAVRRSTREEIDEENKSKRALVQSAKTIANFCHKNPSNTFKKRQLQQRQKGTWRDLAPLELVIDYALDQGWIERRENGYGAGLKAPI